MMDLKDVPKSRWELFNTLLLRGLLRRDLPGMEAEVVTSDFCQLPPECQQALLLLCDLALDGLLAEQPKLVFKYADIVAKCKGQPKTVKDNLLEVAKSVMVSFCETDETQEEVTHFHFLHLSFQEFFAAMTLKYPTGEHAEKNGTLRLASCARTLMIGERFDNFWLFAAGFFKTDPEVFFRTLFSNVSIDMTTISVQQLSMQSMLFKMLQEMIPEVSDYHTEKYSSALELISVFLNRKVSDVQKLYKQGPYFKYIPVENFTDSAALCHALRLLPNLITLEVQSLTGFGDVLAALQGQRKLETVLVDAYDLSRGALADEEVKSVASLLHTKPVVRLKVDLTITAKQLQFLARELSKMKHSLKELALCVSVKEKEEDLAVAMVFLCSALSEHHTSLLCLELAYIQLDNYSVIQPLTLLLRHSRNLLRLGLWHSVMSRHTFEMFCSAVQANKSLTALHLAFEYSFIKRHHPWAPENQDDRHVSECIQQVSHVAVHHERITTTGDWKGSG